MTLSKSTIKYIKSLRLKKFRQKYNNFIVEGDKMARELLLKAGTFEIVALLALPSWMETNAGQYSLAEDRLFKISLTDLKKVSALSTPNQVLLVVRKPEFTIDEKLLKGGLSLFLEGIQDPGNMGTILRIADWFGISYVFFSPSCVELYNPKVIQASMGAFLRVKAIEGKLADLKSRYTGLPVYGTVLGGENIFQAGLSDNGIIVIGNESHGIPKESMQLVNHRLTIPPFGPGGTESLNAAVATGIICAVFRNRYTSFSSTTRRV